MDTSTWSAVENHDQSDPALQFLRRSGSCGAVVYLASLDSMQEVPAGESGMLRRLKAMKAFPGAALIDVTAVDLFKSEAEALVAHAVGIPGDRAKQITAQPLAGIPDDDLVKRVRAFRIVRAFRALYTVAERASRRTRSGMTKRDVLAGEKRLASFLAGDFVLPSNSGPIRRAVFAAIQPLIAAGVRRVNQWGILAPPDTRFDRSFSLAVLPHLPPAIRHSPEDVARIFAAWNSPSRFHLAPGMACASAVDDALHFNTGQTYFTSDQLDQMHAAYFPYVDIFAADVRTRAPLERLQKSNEVSLRASAVPGSSLLAIAEQVAKLATIRFPPQNSPVEAG